MNFRGGMSEAMRQVARLQRKVEAARKELETKEVTVAAASDKVKATATYGKRVARIEVDPEFLKNEDPGLVFDSVVAAVNAALEEAGKAMDAELDKVTGGVKLPGGL